nr:MAG TPA: hypothetical protein [Bacteriophage sp.]
MCFLIHRIKFLVDKQCSNLLKFSLMLVISTP